MNGTATRTATRTATQPLSKSASDALSSRTLPSSDSPTLALGQPTAEEIRTQAKANASSWRGALSLDAYLRREEHLASQALTKDSGITYWVLYDTEEEGPGRRALAGCETLRKRALVSHEGKVQDVIAHGVGSVFTPPEFRGRSYGGRMMYELSNKLKSWQTDETPCAVSVLWSDIGKKFYSKFGWTTFPSAHVHLPPSATPYTNGHTQPQATPLYEDDLIQLCAVDEAMIRERLAKRVTGTAVALIPDHKTIEWHHARENFVSTELHGRRPMVKGAIAQVGDDRVWCVWSRFWYNENPRESAGNTMHILRLVVENKKAGNDDTAYSEAHVTAIASLLRLAQREAHDWHMGEVELWNPTPSTLSAVRQIDPESKVVERDSESIASLRWYGEPDANVEWLENDKFAWC